MIAINRLGDGLFTKGLVRRVVQIRASILLEIKEALKRISVSNGYNNTVTTVSETLLSRDETRELGTPPIICFGAERMAWTHQVFQLSRIELPIAILGYVEESDWTIRSSRLNLLIDDIIVTLSTDPTLNSNADSVYFDSFETDESDPDANPGHGSGGGTCLVGLHVVYYPSG